jgi:hypothetical protein
MPDRYIVLDVEYEPRVSYGRSLDWLCPALKDAPGLRMTEDGQNGNGLVTQRKWAGIITQGEWDALVSDWSIELADSEPNMGMITEYGHLEALAFNWGGMEWNAGGETPISYVSLYVSIPRTDCPWCGMDPAHAATNGECPSDWGVGDD